MIENVDVNDHGILYLSFNQDNSCFTCGMNSGFFVFDSDPFRCRFQRDFDSGISIVEILHRSNILAIVGNEVGNANGHTRNKVIIWDDNQAKFIAELKFRSDVRAVKLRNDRLIVALDTKVYVYDLETLQLIDQYETTHNPNGVLAISPRSKDAIYVTPAITTGYVRIDKAKSKIDTTSYKHNVTTSEIKATGSPIAKIAIDQFGTKIAVASQKGTIIRVFDLETKELIDEFRRGSKSANIQSLSFNPDASLLALTSDHKTIHIFQINENNKLSSLNRGPLSFFSSKWNSETIHLDPPESYSICGFVNNNTLIILGSSGTYFQYKIIRDGSSITSKLVSQKSFIH